MLNQLLTTKLYIPPLRATLTPRFRLVQQLEETLPYTPLTLIAAPAGFGKTTLLSAWRATEAGGALPPQIDEKRRAVADAHGLRSEVNRNLGLRVVGLHRARGGLHAVAAGHPLDLIAKHARSLERCSAQPDGVSHDGKVKGWLATSP